MKSRRVAIGAVVAATLGAGALAGCGGGAAVILGTASSETFGADQNSHLVREIDALYPGAKQIQVTYSKDNPNFVQFTTGKGQTCTAFASTTFAPGTTPKELITQPYCRDLVN